MTITRASLPLDDYNLQDHYSRDEGRVFLTGTQALVRLPMVQHALDQSRGMNTAGFISGYRGSPLGGYDQELWRAKAFLKEHQIEFMPAINEDLAATAVLGTQQVESDEAREVDGVFSIWGPRVFPSKNDTYRCRSRQSWLYGEYYFSEQTYFPRYRTLIVLIRAHRQPISSDSEPLDSYSAGLQVPFAPNPIVFADFSNISGTQASFDRLKKS